MNFNTGSSAMHWLVCCLLWIGMILLVDQSTEAFLIVSPNVAARLGHQTTVPLSHHPVLLWSSRKTKSEGVEVLSGNKDPISQGIVTLLTAAVNAFSKRNNSSSSNNNNNIVTTSPNMKFIPDSGAELALDAPHNAIELQSRIERQYTAYNYLWTGDIDYSCFDSNCCFSDPTLTFTGTDTFARNINNLRPIIEYCVPNGGRSELLSIRLNNNNTSLSDDDYYYFVETRWNMVGELSRLPWKPRIDVIGSTKFWFNEPTHQVYLYDEHWEIPAWLAILQIFTMPGTIPNSLAKP